MNEIFVFLKDKSHAFRFPKLEALMSEYDELGVLNCHIHDNDVVGVDEDSLVTDNELFKRFSSLGNIPHYLNIRIANIKLVFPFDQELIQRISLSWILVIKLENEETKLFLKFVGKNIKYTRIIIIFFVKNYFFN